MSDPSSNHKDTIEAVAFQPLSEAAPAQKQGINKVRVAGITIAIIFLVIMLFLLTSRSVQITVVAEAESERDVSIQGLYLPFGSRYLMRPGSYTVAATADGYYDLETELIVTEQDSQNLELVMQPLPGLLTIGSEPAGARVLVDGQELGETPLVDTPVDAGAHTLTLEMERYQPLEQQLDVTGRQVQQVLELNLEPAWAEITVASEPDGAAILIDGEQAGTTPATLEVLQGEHQLIIQAAGFSSAMQDLEVVAQQAQDLGNFVLEPASGVVNLTSTPEGANVTVNGEFRGQTPVTLELSPERSHRLSLSRPGYRRHTETLEMAAASTLDKSITLKAQLGEVKLAVQPSQAKVSINGRSVGNGSRTISLPAYQHSIEVSLAGYATVRKRVTPRPGLQQLIEFNLQTEQEARAARIKPQITTAVGQSLLLFNPADSPRSEFTMGASRREPGRRANEVLHPVALERSFYLQTTEVTNAQFRQFQSDHDSGQIEGNSLNREHQPVVQVSWQQATQFCNWLSRKEGLPPFYRENKGIVTGYNRSATGYRLPTEAEWAWAARVEGDTVKKFTWGDNFPPSSAVENYADNTSAYVTGRILNGYTDGHVVSAPVGTFPATSKGLFDLGGNVAEWIHDVYIIPSANDKTAVDPLGSQSGDNYVIRGASWSLSKLTELRLSFRDYGQAGRDDVGFRIARYAE
ncbi:MAG: PEGA domain-containing protein [Halioglobus sp.]